MSKHHSLGDANTNLGYYNYRKRLLTSVNLTTSNSFWSNTKNVLEKCITEKEYHEIQNGYSLHSEYGPSLWQSHQHIVSVVTLAR